ncbi:MAG: glycosyltransferase family A protein [Bacteroidota bacterium]
MALTLEILIATMYQTDLSFLDRMFSKNDHFSNYNLLIVNQTDEDKLLESPYPNVRVINSYKRGSPESRNLAINNAQHDICLMADDDIVYEFGFAEKIITAYENTPEADLISFEAINEFNEPYANYFPKGLHSKKSLRTIYTWVISFRRSVFIDHNIYFNHYFGVGSEFHGETEIIFLRKAFDKGVNMHHMNETIVMHNDESSGRFMGSDNALYARSAAAHHFYGNLSYIWLLKYVLFILRHKYISFKQVIAKFKIGLKGISKYKDLVRTGEIDKIYGD